MGRPWRAGVCCGAASPGPIRPDVEDLHDLTTSMTADIRETATRVFVIYKMNNGFVNPGARPAGDDDSTAASASRSIRRCRSPSPARSGKCSSACAISSAIPPIRRRCTTNCWSSARPSASSAASWFGSSGFRLTPAPGAPAPAATLGRGSPEPSRICSGRFAVRIRAVRLFESRVRGLEPCVPICNETD